MSQKILKLVGPVHVVGGLLLFLTAFFPGAQAVVASLANLPPGGALSPFFVAILGPTIASWGVLFTAIVNQYLLTPSSGLWNAMVFAVLVWAPLDTGLCLYFGITGGAVLNAIVVIVLIGLLAAVKGMADWRAEGAQ